VRRYLAIVRLGASAPVAAGVDRGVIDLPVHTEYIAGRRRIARPGEPSLEARTRWRVRERFGGAALLELELETGRQHQIRLHLAQVGMPVLGDLVYGSPRGGGRGSRRLDADRQMLHASWLELSHPLTGVKVRAESPLPQDLRALLDQLRGEPSPARDRTTRRSQSPT
jgi:23S rRNA pseudouridine1911/1915/1917 synthase